MLGVDGECSKVRLYIGLSCLRSGSSRLSLGQRPVEPRMMMITMAMLMIILMMMVMMIRAPMEAPSYKEVLLSKKRGRSQLSQTFNHVVCFHLVTPGRQNKDKQTSNKVK